MTTEAIDLSRAQWQTSSYSGGNGGQCVEVARNLPGVVAIRDSKRPDGFVLAIGTCQWAGFVAAVKSGAFDIAGERYGRLRSLAAAPV